MKETLRVLYVDDNDIDRELVRHALKADKGGFELTEAASREEFEEKLDGKLYHLILSDFNILGFEGLKVIETVRKRGLEVPIVIVTGTGSEEVAVTAIKEGAADYVIKTPDHIRRLPHTLRNVHENHRAERAFRESEARYRALYETMLDGIVYQDSDGLIISANPAAEEILGRTVEQMMGMGAEDPAWKSIRENGTEFPGKEHPSMKALKTGRPVKNVVMGVWNPRDKKRRWINIHAVPQFCKGKKRPDCVYTTFRDITQRKTLEERWLSNLRFLEILLDTIPNPVFFKDTQGRYQGCNQAFADQVLGLPKKEITGKTLKELKQKIPSDQASVFQTHDEALFRNPGTQFYESKVLCADGKQHDFLFNKATYTDAAGKTAGLVGIMVDVTEIRHAEARIKTSLSEKEVMLKEIHHRVKNNMQVIISLLRLQAHRLDDPIAHNALLITQNRIRSMALVHERLYKSEDIARIDFAEYARHLATHLMSIFQGTGGDVDLKIEAESLFLGISEAIPLGLILNELLSNAFRHAFPEKPGSIRVLIETKTSGDQEDTVCLQVIDNGCGIPSDLDLNNIQTLGMQLITDLTRQLGGRFSFRSEGGSIAEVEFPIHPPD